MSKDELIELLREFKKKEAQLRLKEIERKKKELALEQLVKQEYEVNITPTYTEGSKSNEIKSKIEKVIVNKEEKRNQLEEEIKELDKEINLLQLEVEEINVRLGMLNYIEKEILTDYYVNENKLEDIGNFTYYRIRQQTRGVKAIKRIIEKALKKMIEI